MKFLSTILLYTLSLSAFSQVVQRTYPVSDDQASVLIKKVLKVSPVVDGHNDLFIHYFDCKNCPRGLTDYRIDTLNSGHTDIPRMRQGGVGGLMLNVFGRERTEQSYMEAWALLHQTEKKYGSNLKIVKSSSEMKTAFKEGKIALLPSLEGAVRLGDNLELINKYYKLGLRSVTFAYSTNLLADGSDDTIKYNGISAFGKSMVAEMNKLGVLIDMSHISVKAMADILEISKAPVLFSHSNVRALCDVNRNVPDSVLLKLKENRGMIMLTFVPYFVKKEHMQWLDEGDALYYKTLNDYPDDSLKMESVMTGWEKLEPAVTVADMADQFDYVKKLIGVDYIGMAGDFDGINYTIKGLEDTSTYPNLLLELAKRGWKEDELRKIASENFLRIFKEVEKQAFAIQKTKPYPVYFTTSVCFS
jgi:membrane dipeptidase